jgi:hypothetical protein
VVAAAIVVGCGGSQSTSESKVHEGGSPARAQTYEFDATSGARVQATLDRVRDEERIPGVSAALVIAGKTLWTGTSGEADTRTHERVTDRTLFAAGSITKTFMAALTLRLVEDRVLDLDDHLSRWVPSFQTAARSRCVRCSTTRPASLPSRRVEPTGLPWTATRPRAGRHRERCAMWVLQCRRPVPNGTTRAPTTSCSGSSSSARRAPVSHASFTADCSTGARSRDSCSRGTSGRSRQWPQVTSTSTMTQSLSTPSTTRTYPPRPKRQPTGPPAG